MSPMRATIVASALMAMAACKFPPPPDVPDEDGATAADATTDSRSCAPDSVVCADGKLTVCDSQGTFVSYSVPNGGADGSPIDVVLDAYPCPLGCDPGGQRCADVAPANGLGVALDATGQTGPDIVIDDPSGEAALSTQQDLQNGSAFIFYNGGVGDPIAIPATIVQQVDGPEIVALTVRSFTLKPGVKLRVAGSRAFAIVAHLDVFIGGTLDASGHVWGPGASTVASCNVIGANGALGGAGNYHDGGASSTGVAGGTNLRARSPDLIPLEGGCASWQAMGLTAGGAVQLVSRTRIAIGPAGILSVAGKAGAGRLVGGQLLVTGGGSGGAVRLEAPSIQFAQGSHVVGRGGSGAAANTINNSFQNGVSGDADLAASSVPGATCSGCGIGGNGGTSSVAPLSGQGSGSMLGAGGGSAGRCVVATRSGVLIPPSGTLMIVSQNAQVGIR